MKIWKPTKKQIQALEIIYSCNDLSRYTPYLWEVIQKMKEQRENILKEEKK